MIQVLRNDKLPDEWDSVLDRDPRAQGLLDLHELLCAVLNADLPPSPLELAYLFRDMAGRIEAGTDADLPMGD
jgi:hypothetical protein